MALATANYFLKWLSRLIPIKRSDTLTATLGNDSGSKESVNQQQRRELPLHLVYKFFRNVYFFFMGSDPGVPYIKYVSKIEFFNASTFQCKLELTLVILSVYPSY